MSMKYLKIIKKILLTAGLWVFINGCSQPFSVELGLQPGASTGTVNGKLNTVNVNLTDLKVESENYFIVEKGHLSTVDEQGSIKNTLGPVGAAYNSASGRVTLTGSAASLVTVDSVLSLEPSPQIPVGLLRKIINISLDGNKVVFDTEEASLVDVIRQGEIEIKGTVAPGSEVITSQYSASGAFLSRTVTTLGRSRSNLSSGVKPSAARLLDVDMGGKGETFQAGYALTATLSKEKGKDPQFGDPEQTSDYQAIRDRFDELSGNDLATDGGFAELVDGFLGILALVENSPLISDYVKDTNPPGKHDLDYVSPDQRLKIKGDAAFELTAEIGITLDVYIKIKIEPTLDLAEAVKELEVRITPRIYIASTNQANGSLHLEYKLGEFNAGHIPIFAGLWVTPQMEFFVGALAEAEATLNLGQTITATKGIKYIDNGGSWNSRWSLINNDFVVKNRVDSEIASSFAIQPYFKFNVLYLFNSVFGPGAQFTPYARFALDISDRANSQQQDWWKLQAGINAGLSLQVDFFAFEKTIGPWSVNLPPYTIASAGETFSQALSRKNIVTRPSAPDGIVASVGDSELSVSWNRAASASGYELYWHTDNDASTIPSANRLLTTGNEAVIDGLNNGVRYYLWVKSTNSAGAGVYSQGAGPYTPQVSVVPAQTVSIVNPAASFSLKAGATVDLRAVLSPADATNQNVNWTCSPTGAFTFSGNGPRVTATARSKGPVTITATVDGREDSISGQIVASTIPVTAIEIPKVTLQRGGRKTAEAIVSPDNATDKRVVWSLVAASDDCVTIDASTGLIEARGVGAAQIKATAADGSDVTAYGSVEVNRGANDDVAWMWSGDTKAEYDLTDTIKIEVKMIDADGLSLVYFEDGGGRIIGDTRMEFDPPVSEYTLTDSRRGSYWGRGTHYITAVAIDSTGKRERNSLTPRGHFKVTDQVPDEPRIYWLEKGADFIHLDWNNVGAAEYTLYRSQAGGAKQKVFNSSYQTSHKDTGLVPGVTYYYTLIAENFLNGESYRSTVDLTVKTKNRGEFNKTENPWQFAVPGHGEPEIIDGGNEEDRGWIEIAVSDIPAGTRMTGVSVDYEIREGTRSDQIIEVRTQLDGRWYVYRLGDRSYNYSNSFTKFNNGSNIAELNPEGVWYLVVWDEVNNQLGEVDGWIDSFTLTIEYEY